VSEIAFVPDASHPEKYRLPSIERNGGNDCLLLTYLSERQATALAPNVLVGACRANLAGGHWRRAPRIIYK
jgi:hypothetical protein